MLQILAEEDAAVSPTGRREQDAVPPRETVPILNLPGKLCDVEIIGGGAKAIEIDDISTGRLAWKQSAPFSQRPIAFIQALRA
jgi:hypothetical protein